MEILISDQQTRVPLNPDLETVTARVAQACLEQFGGQHGPDVEVSITFVDDAMIQELNRDHRGLDRPTDVLSFSQLEPGEGEPGFMPTNPDESIVLGDVVVSLERACEQAADYGHSLEREIGFLVAHGILHLLGYDHQTAGEEKQMQAATEEVLSGLGLLR